MENKTELTDDQKLCNYYQFCQDQLSEAYDSQDRGKVERYIGQLSGIHIALIALGITVEGINDTNTSTDAT